jgi:hypothetical protein
MKQVLGPKKCWEVVMDSGLFCDKNGDKNQKVWMKRSENTDLIPWFWMLISLKKDGFATY